MFHYDLVIIGGGPAGIACSEYFIKSQKKVLIIESGNDDIIQNYPNKKNKVIGNFKIDFIKERKRAFFGTTALWKKTGVGGTFWEFDFIDFEKNKKLKWGINYSELKEAYNEAWNYLDILPIKSNPFKAIQNKSWEELIKKYYIKLASSHYTFGSKYEEFILKKKKELLNSKNISILFNTNLESIILNKEKNKVEKLTLSRNNNKKFDLYCGDVVLAAGCFENNLLLQDLKEKNNLNLSALGKYLTFHPSIKIGKFDLLKNKYFSKKELKIFKKVFILKNKNTNNNLNYGVTLNPEVKNLRIKKSILNKIEIIKESLLNKKIKTFLLYLISFFIKLDFFNYIIYKIKNYFYSSKFIDVSIVFEHLPYRCNNIRINKKSKSFNIKSYLGKKIKNC